MVEGSPVDFCVLQELCVLGLSLVGGMVEGGGPVVHFSARESSGEEASTRKAILSQYCYSLC